MLLLPWLNRLLNKKSPSIPGKYITMDLGGELGKNKEVQDLFDNHSYKIRLNSPDSSHKNALIEQTHQKIADAMRSMLEGANLNLKYWPYDLYHFSISITSFHMVVRTKIHLRY